MAFVDNMNVAVLGSAGLLILIFTVVSLVKQVEESFNYIWNVKQGRGAIEQLRDYLSILLVGPILAVSAAGLATTVQQSDLVLQIQQVHPMGALLVGFLRFTPKIIVFAIFVFLYAFIPNVRVKWLAAAAGALVAAALWLVAGWGFTSFIASSSKYTAIYSSFAVLILFLIWLNLNWLFVLMGANIAYYVQYPDQLLLARGNLRPSARTREWIAMQAMFNIGRDYEGGHIHWSGESLRSELNIPGEVIKPVLQDMVAAGLLVKTASEQHAQCFLPGLSCDRILLEDIVRAVNRAGQSYGKNHNWDERVQQLFEQLEGGARESLKGSTLADLVRAESNPEPGHQSVMSQQHEKVEPKAGV
jgi:membrane protein